MGLSHLIYPTLVSLKEALSTAPALECLQQSAESPHRYALWYTVPNTHEQGLWSWCSHTLLHPSQPHT